MHRTQPRKGLEDARSVDQGARFSLRRFSRWLDRWIETSNPPPVTVLNPGERVVANLMIRLRGEE